MRIPADIIREEGTHISPHSKFYIWGDMLFEPSVYRGKLTKSYKPVTDVDRISKALARHNEMEEVPTVSSVVPHLSVKDKSTFKQDRFAILDFSKDKL